MPATYFFYDLETSGLSPRSDRIMQFAGQRTDLNFKPLKKPFNLKIKLPNDCLPSVKALLLTGISPLQKGLTELEFLKIFNNEINTQDTIFVGYNNIRFDDEFIRYLNYRNFSDPYKWHWDKNNSRWDILDLVRMTRALRPEGITWPLDDKGQPTNKLETLTKANNLNHSRAHDALSDVLATIEVVRLIHSKQPKLFNYLKELRTKKSVTNFLKNNQTFIYTSSHFMGQYLNTTLVALMDLDLNEPSSALVYDLRQDPSQYLKLTVKQLTESWIYDPSQKKYLLPFKTVKLNRCPAFAPISTLDKDSEKRLSINKKECLLNYAKLLEYKDVLLPKVLEARKILNSKRDQKSSPPLINENLYGSFDSVNDQVKKALILKDPFRKISFNNKALNDLYVLFMAYNYQDKLNPDQKIIWKKHLKQKLFTKNEGLSNYDKFLLEIKESQKNYKKSKIIEDLKAYANLILSEYEKS